MLFKRPLSILSLYFEGPHWRDVKLDTEDCPSEILYADIRDMATLTKENLEFALCRFIVEVKKSRHDGDYPGRGICVEC